MKAAPLLLVGILLFGAGASAQEARPVDAAEQRVAELIREALRSPDAPENWAGLAQGLSTLESMGSANDASMEAAIRVADSLAFSPLLIRTGASEREEQKAGARAFLGTVKGRLKSLAAGFLEDPTSALSLLGLLMGGWILFGKISRFLKLRQRVREFTEVVRGVARVASGGGKRRLAAAQPRQDPRELVLALSKHGIPANEISRQTGLAQDEVAVVLALRTRGGSFGGSDLSTQRRSA